MSVPSGLSTPVATGFPSLESIFGPMLIGILLSTAIWGITCVQTFDYFITPNEDLLWQKLVVVLIYTLDTFDTVLNTHVLYYFLVKNFANPHALLSAPWPTFCRSLLNGLESFIVRAMFARRVYLVSKKNVILTVWIMATSSAHLVVGVLITVKSLIGLNAKALPNISHLLFISFSLGIASDASTTLALYWLLHSVKTGIRRTDSLVKVLLLYIVTTGLLVVIDSTLGLAFYIAMPKNVVYIGFYLLLGKLYINAYLASLNARGILRNGQTNVVISLTGMDNQTSQSRQISETTNDSDKLTSHRSDNAMAITLQTRRTSNHEGKNMSSADFV